MASSKAALSQIDSVEEAVLPYFSDAAASLIASKGADKALALALAVIAGQTKAVNERSLLSSAAGWVTLCLTSKRAGEEIRTLSYVWTLIRKFLYPTEESVDTKSESFFFLLFLLLLLLLLLSMLYICSLQCAHAFFYVQSKACDF